MFDHGCVLGYRRMVPFKSCIVTRSLGYSIFGSRDSLLRGANSASDLCRLRCDACVLLRPKVKTIWNETHGCCTVVCSAATAYISAACWPSVLGHDRLHLEIGTLHEYKYALKLILHCTLQCSSPPPHSRYGGRFSTIALAIIVGWPPQYQYSARNSGGQNLFSHHLLYWVPHCFSSGCTYNVACDCYG